MQMNWSVLGIEETKDKKAITAAYRKRVTQVNPEDKPEEFKELRAAYEEALRLADVEETEQERDETPVGLWMERVRALYDEFSARICPENWKELLAEDICVALDVRPEAEDRLLCFLMQDYYLPQSVWQILDEAFAWSERRQELYEHYPKDFVDYAVMNGIRYPAALPYELFSPGERGKDCDQYRRLYNQVNQSAPEEVPAVLDQMDQLSEWHPYGQALRHRWEIESGETEKGREGYRRLAAQYPNDTTLVLGWAGLCVEAGDGEESERLARCVLEQEPDHWQAKWILSQSLDKQDRQDEAKTLIFELIRAAGGDQKQIMQLMDVVKQLNEKLIVRRTAVFEENPEDVPNALELAWCYLQNDREQDALAICRRVPQDHENQFDYHQLFAKASFACREYDEALIHVQKVQEIIAGLVPDGTKETDRRIGKRPEMLQMEGRCYLMLERKAEAIEKYEQSVEAAPEDAEVLTKMAHLLIQERQYERATGYLQRLIELRPGSYHGYLLIATCLYELRRDREAFDAVNRALELERGDLGVYLLRMRILLRNGVWDGVRSTLDFLRQNGIDNEITMSWCEAQMMEFETKDFSRALELYREIAVRIEEKGEYLPEAAALYYRIAILVSENKNVDKEEDCRELIEILEKGLMHDAADYDCIFYKAWLLKQINCNEEAIRLFLRLEKVSRTNLRVEQELAELYYRDLGRNKEKALYYYEKLLESEDIPFVNYYVGVCMRFMGRFDEAEKFLLRQKELTPQNCSAYVGLYYVYADTGRYEAALEQIDKAMEFTAPNKKRDRYACRIEILCRLGRPLEALKAVDEGVAQAGYIGGQKKKFNICCQFAMWDQAERCLKAWRISGQDPIERVAAEIKLAMYQGRLRKAQLKLIFHKKELSKGEYMYNDDFDSLSLLLAEIKGDFKRQKEIRLRRLQQDRDRSHTLLNLAEICWHCGNMSEAKYYAEQALVDLDVSLSEQKSKEALFRARRSMALAILDRRDEAKAELEATRRLPICTGCPCSTCKDADIFEALMEELYGNFERAVELNREGNKRWPQEFDFYTNLRRLKRKGF